MIGFLRPELLLLALPWLAFWLWFARRQRHSCEWVWANVHERFHQRFTLYRRRNLARHLALLLVLGLLLVAAAAGPGAPGEVEVRELSSRVVLLLDGSASMLADDLQTAEGAQTRFVRGREIAVELAERLEGSRFALVVFSGVAALQLPMTADAATIAEAVGTASFHAFYRSSGSSFTAALDAALHFVELDRPDLQVVLLSDGEQPFDEPYDAPLAALAEAAVPVHAVAIGSRQGQSRLIFDFRDVVAGKEEKRVLREYTTRREDRHLKRIARATGGRFTTADGGAAEEVAAAIERRIAGAETVRAAGRRDLTGVPLTLFLIGFLLESLVWGRRRGQREVGFDIDRLGGGRPVRADGSAARPIRSRAGLGRGLVALLLIAGPAVLACRDDSPRGRASRENERGIAADALGSWPQARVHYDRSRAFGVRPEIPAYNLARSVTLQEDWSEAHDLYQAALELAPRLAVGHYNDGHVLYRWGEAELDLEGCQLDRALELWEAARRRFAGAAELFAEDSDGRDRARANLRFVAERMARVEEACAPPPPQPAAGAGGEAEAGGGGENGSEGGGGRGGQERSPGGAAGEDPEHGKQSEGESGDRGEEEAEGGDRGEEGEDEGEAEDPGEDEGEGSDRGEDEGQDGDQDEEEGQGGGEGENENEGEDAGGEGEDEGEGGATGESEGEGGAGGGEGENRDQGEGRGEDEGEGAGGGGEGGGGAAGSPPLSGAELEQIQQALARIAAERFADGRYHYRSLPEQFPREVWENPEAEIWW